MDSLVGYDDSDSDDATVPAPAPTPVPVEAAPPAKAPKQADENTQKALEDARKRVAELEELEAARRRIAELEQKLGGSAGADTAGEEKEKEKKEKKKKKKKDKKKKKKDKEKKPTLFLPSAASLLANMPDTLLGRPENIILSDEEEGRVDGAGTKYNAVAPPASVNAGISELDVWRMKPTLSMEKQREAWNQLTAKANKDAERQKRKVAMERAGRSGGGRGGGHGNGGAVAMSSAKSTMFAPRQVSSKKANVSTEDLGAWNAAKKAKKSE